MVVSRNRSKSKPAGGAIYGLGSFGAWVDFGMQATGFWDDVLADLGWIVWQEGTI